MKKLVREYKKNPEILLLARGLTKHLPQKDWRGEVRAIHRYVRDGIRYVKDIRGIETLATPVKTIEIGSGDCDDKSTLTAALLESIGHPTRFVVVGPSPNKFVHVYVETKIGQNWVPVETTEPWEVGEVRRKMPYKYYMNN